MVLNSRDVLLVTCNLSSYITLAINCNLLSRRLSDVHLPVLMVAQIELIIINVFDMVFLCVRACACACASRAYRLGEI